MRISHKDHMHPKTKNWTAKCKRQMDAGGEPIVMDGFQRPQASYPPKKTAKKAAKHVLSEEDFARLNEGLRKPQANARESKFFELGDLLELGMALNDVADTLNHLGLEAMYENGNWTLKTI